MNKNYWNYLLKNNRNSLIFIGIADLLLMAAILFSYYDTHFTMAQVRAALIGVSVMSGILTFTLPVRLFRHVHDKKAVDTFFQLNVSREDMLHTTLAFIALAVIAPFVLGCGVLMIYSLIHYGGLGINYPLFMGMVIPSFIGLILFHSWIFLLANSTFDGIVMIGAYTFLPLLLLMVLNAVIDAVIYAYYPSLDWVGYLSLTFTTVTQGINILTRDFFHVDSSIPLWLICIAAHAVIGYLGLRKEYVQRKLERAETLSNHPLAYPLIMNLYALALILVSSTAFHGTVKSLSPVIIQYVLIFILYIIANFVYKRKIQVTKESVIFFVAAILISLLFTGAAYKTKGFHLSEKFNRHPDAVSASLYGDYHGSVDARLREVLDQKGYDWSSLSVFVDYNDKVKKSEDYEGFLNVLNELRLRSIDEYYTKKDAREYSGYLRITEADKEKRTEKNYTYNIAPATLVDYDLLLRFNKYADVNLQMYNVKDMTYETVSLDSLLK